MTPISTSGLAVRFSTCCVRHVYSCKHPLDMLECPWRIDDGTTPDSDGSGERLARSVRRDGRFGPRPAAGLFGHAVPGSVHPRRCRYGSRGVFADRGVELRVVNTLIANNGVSGMGLQQGSQAIVQGSTIRDHAVEDFGVGTVIQAAGIGINVGSGSRLRLVNSVVRDNGVSGAENPMLNTGIITEFSALPAPISQPESEDAASVELIDSRIDGNAQGVLLGQQTDLSMKGTSIRDSHGWGLAGLAGPCMTVGLFERIQQMTGSFQFERGNLIEDNNGSGKLDGQGNPGPHPFHYLPDGQVCLPH